MKWLREPLLHFVMAGGVLFGAYAWVADGTPQAAATERRTVRIGTNDVQWLAESWHRQWQREPTREELQELASAFLKEELLCREAREMGLDRDDTIVRRRLAQKLQFLIQDNAGLAAPTEDDLRRFYAENPEWFRDDARVSFIHVYFDREERKDAAADATAALRELASLDGTMPEPGTGDPLLIGSEFRDVTEQTVSGQFGRDFARALFGLKPGVWEGPLGSAYGLHLVRVLSFQPERIRDFAEVRGQVLERWLDRQKSEMEARYLAGLLKKYDVVMDDRVRTLVGRLDESLSDGMYEQTADANP